MASWCINEMAQGLKERVMGGNNLFQLFYGCGDIRVAVCIVWSSIKEIKTVAIDDKFDIIGMTQWSDCRGCSSKPFEGGLLKSSGPVKYTMAVSEMEITND